MKMTAAIIIAAKVARGMKLKYGVRNSRAKITSVPENNNFDACVIVRRMEIYAKRQNTVCFLLGKVNQRKIVCSVVKKNSMTMKIPEILRKTLFVILPRP